MPQVVLITGAGSGFGRLGAQSLAAAGHVVYGGLHSARAAATNNPDPTVSTIRDVVLDITSKQSIEEGIQKILSETGGRLDCVIHNAGHMGMGPAESFSDEQYHHYYDINAVGAHRLNQAVLPLMRKAGRGHLVWISSSSCRGGSGPLLAPYFVAKAAMHALAVTLSTEIACWGIETTIIVPGIFTSGTRHFANAGNAAFPDVAAEYMNGPLHGADTVMLENVASKFPKDATPQLVADAIVQAVDAPIGQKKRFLYVDPFQDGSEQIMALADLKHQEYLERCGIAEICALTQNRQAEPRT